MSLPIEPDHNLHVCDSFCLPDIREQLRQAEDAAEAAKKVGEDLAAAYGELVEVARGVLKEIDINFLTVNEEEAFKRLAKVLERK